MQLALPFQVVAVKRKRGDRDCDGNVFWNYNRGREVWLSEPIFNERRDRLHLHLKTKRVNNPEWRRKQNERTSIRNSDPEQAKKRLKRKRERYNADERLRKQILAKNKISRQAMSPQERRRRLTKHLDYCNKRYREDPLFNLSTRVRRRIKIFLKGSGLDKRTATRQMIGCDTATLKAHLEAKFSEGMSWDNKNKWHIDHIIPLASAKSQDEIEALCHYTNLQPLWAIDNIKKGNKIL